jgi:aminoglycoside phosphotransferase (APT) family kinase protein
MENDATTCAVVARLVEAQFPGWAHLPVTRVDLGGHDNTTFRLGDELCARLPSADEYVPQVEKEHRWLPVLAPRLPLPIPEPVARGAPGPGFPRPWSVYRWRPGEPARASRVEDDTRFATDLAGFLAALQAIDPAGGPAPGAHSFLRGGPITALELDVRRSIAALAGDIDTRAAIDIWEAAAATTWEHPPVWVHGDITGSNLLVSQGRLTAVLDFGCSAVGDPACDLAIAWTFFTSESREAFRAALPLDQGTWARGRGWALWKALITLAAVRSSNPETTDAAGRFGWRLNSRGTLEEVLRAG